MSDAVPGEDGNSEVRIHLSDAVPKEGGNSAISIKCVWCSARGRWEFCDRNTVCLMQCPGNVGILWKEYSVSDAVPGEGGNSVEGIQCV